MPDDKPPENQENTEPKDKNGKKPQNPRPFSLKPAGEVVLTHHDAPPPSGKQRIHPRRPLPPVPERANDEDTKNEQDSQNGSKG
jgi:hypothetical protein